MVTRASSEIAVIGAGLAGVSAARALARAGFCVHIFEAQSAAAQGASGNPIGIYHPLFSRDYNLASQLFDCGIRKTLGWISELNAGGYVKEPSLMHHACGVLQIAQSADESLSWQKAIDEFGFDSKWLSYLSAKDCALTCDSDLALPGFTNQSFHGFSHGGLWSASGGWISPPRFIDAMLSDAQNHGAKISYASRVKSISKDGVVFLDSGETRKFDHVVVCSGEMLSDLFPNAQLGITPIACSLDIYDVRNSEDSLKAIAPACVICLDGYLTPIVEGAFSVGATFDRPDSEDPVSNAERLFAIAPQLAQRIKNLAPLVRRSYRSATIDRMPHVGRILDDSEPLAASVSLLHQMPRMEKLWAIGGFGSRGLSLAPLAAEVLLALIRGEEPGIDSALLRAVDPVRFALRRHQRNPGKPC